MTMSAKCELQINSSSEVFHPGQVISGNIYLKLDDRVLLKSFAYKFSGFAAIRWEKPLSTKKQKHQNDGNIVTLAEKPKKFYENRDDYLAITNFMIGSEAALSHIVEAGNYSYNFNVRLPDHCPSSVESTYGHIRYEIVIFIVYPDRNETMITRRFKVMQPFDLRLNYQLLEPANIDRIEPIVRTYSTFWQRPLQLHVNVPQTGYIAGEKISVYVKILNNGFLVLEHLVYKLNMVATYIGYSQRGKMKTKVERTNMLTTFYALRSQKVNILEHLHSIHLPETFPSLFAIQCHCMQLSYEVEVVVHTNNVKRVISAQVPLVVGTISLQNREQPLLMIKEQKVVPLDREVLELEASAPPAESMEVEHSAALPSLATNNWSVSMSSLTSSFKEADYMTPKNLNKEFKQTMAGAAVDFKPKYLYYNLDANIQEAEVSSTN